jgi:hypothetical protein
MASHRPLPMKIAEITAEWLTAALRTQAPGVTVRGVEVVDVINGTSTKVRLRLDLDEAAQRAGIPAIVILKGGFEPHSRAMEFIHQKEVCGYRDILPAFGLPSPASYFADFSEEQHQGIVIMEDLVARGVTFCDPLKPQSYERISRRLTVLARFHARTWGTTDFLPGGRWQDINPMLVSLRPYFERYLAPETWKRCIASPQGAAASVRFLDREWAIGALDRLTSLSCQLPHSIVHGDTHLGNLYIDKDGSPGFYDAIPSRAPGILEVSYHMTSALDTADQARWEGPLVRDYLAELGRNGVETPSFDEAMRQYGAFLAFGILTFIINETLFQASATNTAYVARFNTAMLRNNTAGLLDALTLQR